MLPETATREPGERVAEFSRTRSSNLISLAWLAPLLVGAVGVVILLAFGRLEDQVRGWLRPVLIAGLLPAVWLLGMGVVHVVRNWDLRLTLYRHGMVQRTWRGEQSVSWADVAELWTLGDRDLRLRTHDGGDVTVDGITWTDDASRRIASLTLTEMLPKATETLRRGGRLSFGPLAVTRKGLEVRGTAIPWADVELRPGLHASMITIRDRGSGRIALVSIRDVPNVHLLRAVLPDATTDG